MVVFEYVLIWVRLVRMMASKKLQPVQRSDAVKFELKILSVADFHRARGNLAYDPTGCYVLVRQRNCMLV